VTKDPAKSLIKSDQQVSFPGSSSKAISTLKENFQKWSDATGKSAYLYIGISPKTTPSILMTEDKEKLRNLVKPTDSEEREIKSEEKDKNTKRATNAINRVVKQFGEEVRKTISDLIDKIRGFK